MYTCTCACQFQHIQEKGIFSFVYLQCRRAALNKLFIRQIHSREMSETRKRRDVERKGPERDQETFKVQSVLRILLLSSCQTNSVFSLSFKFSFSLSHPTVSWPVKLRSVPEKL